MPLQSWCLSKVLASACGCLSEVLVSSLIKCSVLKEKRSCADSIDSYRGIPLGGGMWRVLMISYSSCFIGLSDYVWRYYEFSWFDKGIYWLFDCLLCSVMHVFPRGDNIMFINDSSWSDTLFQNNKTCLFLTLLFLLLVFHRITSERVCVWNSVLWDVISEDVGVIMWRIGNHFKY